MLVQTKLFSPPATTPEAEMQQKMMKYMMVFMAFMFYKVPSGLGLYFITSSLWPIGERLLLPKVRITPPTPRPVAPARAAPAAAGPAAGAAARRAADRAEAMAPLPSPRDGSRSSGRRSSTRPTRPDLPQPHLRPRQPGARPRQGP